MARPTRLRQKKLQQSLHFVGLNLVPTQPELVPLYRKIGGIFRNPAVQRELKSLTPERDYQRMVQLLVGYEFPFDITRALELALFHTFASPSISALLARTGEFDHYGQQRYDDTNLIIARFMQDGLDSPTGQRAIAHMNRLHGFYRIPNDDYLLVLSTFVFYPIRWIRQYGWRPLTHSEELALFYFFREVGHRMNLQDVPETIEAMAAFTEAYEHQHFRYTKTNRLVADQTVRIVAHWFPAFLRPLVQPVFATLISDSLRRAFGYQEPNVLFQGLIKGGLWLRKWPLRWVTFKPYPVLIENSSYRSYPAGAPPIEATGPEKLRRKIEGEPND